MSTIKNAEENRSVEWRCFIWKSAAIVLNRCFMGAFFNALIFYFQVGLTIVLKCGRPKNQKDV